MNFVHMVHMTTYGIYKPYTCRHTVRTKLINLSHIERAAPYGIYKLCAYGMRCHLWDL